MTSFNESIVEDATLIWFGQLGYAIGQRHSNLGLRKLFQPPTASSSAKTPRAIACSK